MAVKKKKRLYEGKSKTLYETDTQDQLLIAFKDNVPGADITIENKGAVNNHICALIFRYLESYNIATHYVSESENDSMVVRRLNMFPFDIVVHNRANAALAKQVGVKNGEALSAPRIEFYSKDDIKKNSPMNRKELLKAGLIPAEILQSVERMVVKINAILKSFFTRRDLLLASIKLEFGRHKDRVILGDEISIDTCGLWDAETGEQFDIKNHRNEVETIQQYFQEISQRLL